MTTTTLITCKKDYEKILAREISLYDINFLNKCHGGILAQWQNQILFKQCEIPLRNLCFARQVLENPVFVCATSVNSLTEKLINLFIAHIGQERIVAPWARLFSSSGNEQLAHHAKTVEKNWSNKMLKKMSRIAKLAKKDIPCTPEFSEGFFVYFTGFNQAFVSFKALCAGQQRMQMDPAAPSRSYLKIEEAFKIFGHQPISNDTVIDLGAAPGGWSYSAMKRGAYVTAIDNGLLKGVARSNKNIYHLKTDALKYRYIDRRPADWLLCDIIEKPEVILNLLRKWLSQKWCRYFIANIKVGKNDPILLLRKIRDAKGGLLPHCKILRVKQLYHDREEITLMGQVK
ncbi:MAG: SAM-dependent methyltransferase [Candidatus Omnitrophica bacterium]|nr:SAM-dependent methyltransferase [Candidatus Omnitrophota bacterium]